MKITLATLVAALSVAALGAGPASAATITAQDCNATSCYTRATSVFDAAAGAAVEDTWTFHTQTNVGYLLGGAGPDPLYASGLDLFAVQLFRGATLVATATYHVVLPGWLYFFQSTSAAGIPVLPDTDYRLRLSGNMPAATGPITILSFATTVIPLPASLPALGSGLAMLLVLARKGRRRAAGQAAAR